MEGKTTPKQHQPAPYTYVTVGWVWKYRQFFKTSSVATTQSALDKM